MGSTSSTRQRADGISGQTSRGIGGSHGHAAGSKGTVSTEFRYSRTQSVGNSVPSSCHFWLTLLRGESAGPDPVPATGLPWPTQTHSAAQRRWLPFTLSTVPGDAQSPGYLRDGLTSLTD